MNRILVRFLIAPIFFCGFATVTAIAQAPRGVMPISLQVSTTSFPVGGTVPKKYTCDGQDVSPALSWSGAPQGTKSFALVADDPDAPVGTWTHWLVWNILSHTRQFREGVPKTEEAMGARQGQNDFRKIGYNGPCPPPGKPHRYYFKLFALDGELTLQSGGDRQQLDTAIKGHVLAQTELMGRYGR